MYRYSRSSCASSPDASRPPMNTTYYLVHRLYNLLASLFAEGIREYIVRTLHDTLSDNMADLLTALNHYARYAILSTLHSMVNMIGLILS